MRIRWSLLRGQTGHAKGWQLLRELYFEETGCATLPEVAFGEHGKPYFVGSPYHFSITHTDFHAFCVLSETPVGIDAEEENRRVSFSLAKRILSDSEYRQYEMTEHKRRALLIFWVLKEADAKLRGTGLTGFPNETHFNLDDPRVQILDGCYVAVMTEEGEPNAI